MGDRPDEPPSSPAAGGGSVPEHPAGHPDRPAASDTQEVPLLPRSGQPASDRPEQSDESTAAPGTDAPPDGAGATGDDSDTVLLPPVRPVPPVSVPPVSPAGRESSLDLWEQVRAGPEGVRSAPPAPGPRPARRRLAIGATLVAALVLVTAPFVVDRLTDRSSPVASPSPSPELTAGPSAPALLPPMPSTPAKPAPETDDDGGGAGRVLRPQDVSPTPERTSDTTGPIGGGQEPDGPWQMVVDNGTPGRFSAGDAWRRGTGASDRYGGDYRYAPPNVEASDPAWYKVDIPVAGRYRVDVWYPAADGHNPGTPYIVATTSGYQPVHVDQRTGGGRWVTLGTFSLAGGDANVVAVSRWASGDDPVVADAVRVTEVG